MRWTHGLLGTALALTTLCTTTAWADAPLPDAPSPTAGGLFGEGGFFGERVQPTGLVRASLVYSDGGITSAQGKNYDSKTINPSQFGYRQGAVLENAQFGIKGKFTDEHVQYAIKVEMVPREKDGTFSNSAFLRDAWIGWNGWKYLDVRLGWQKAPFSQANLKSTEDFMLPYQPTFDVFTPQRLLGLSVAGVDPDGRWKVTLGAFNSAKQASEQISDWDQTLYAGRAELNIDKFLDKPGFAWRVGGGAAQTKTYFDNGEKRLWFGVDTRAKWRFLEAEAEYVQMQFFAAAAKDGSQPVHTASGWHAELSGWIIEKRLSLTARIEQMDGDDTVVDGQGTDVQTIAPQNKRWVTVGVGYNPSRTSRCVLAYIHRQELEGLTWQNDSGQVTCHLAW